MMKFLYFLLRMAIALPVSFMVWVILFFGFAQSFWLSVGLALSGGALLYGTVQSYMNHIFLKRHQLTRSEYVYIRKNLHEAKAKISRLQKAYFNVRSISSFSQIHRLNRLIKRIYTIVKKEPKRFYEAERFFFYHLDSVVELTEKHAFLAAQAVKDVHLRRSLQETRHTIEQLIQSIEQDLYDLLSTDMNHLAFELDVAKHTLKKWVPPLHERSSKNERTQAGNNVARRIK